MNMSSVSVTTLLSFLGLTTRQCHSSSTSKAKWLIPDFSDCVTDKYESLFREVSDLLLGFFHVFFFQILKVFLCFDKIVEVSLYIGKRDRKICILRTKCPTTAAKKRKKRCVIAFFCRYFYLQRI